MTIGRGRSLAAPSEAVAGDDGQGDPALLAALAASDTAVHQALLAARVFVPVAARLVTADATGADKQSDMALLLLEGGTGSALPVFSSVASLAAWEDGPAAGARPVAVNGADALAHAAAEQLAAVVVDVAGPHQVVLELADSTTYRPGNRSLADSQSYRPGDWPAGKRLKRALRRSGAAEAYLLEVGSDARPAIGLVLSPGTSVAAVVQGFAGALDGPVDVALLDEGQRQAVRAAGGVSVV